MRKDSTSSQGAVIAASFDAELRAEMARNAWEAGQRLPRWEDRARLFLAELDKAYAAA